MDRLLLALAIAVLAAFAAWLIRRNAPATGPTQTGTTPDQLDRTQFVAADVDWLVAVFSSATCLACAEVTRLVSGYETDTVAFQDVELRMEPELHRRYRIDSVPTTVVADTDGVVRGAWIGPLSEADREELRSLLTASS